MLARQIAGKVLAIVGRGAQQRDVDRRRATARLRWRGDLEAADRFDLVAEELDPHRVVPVGREDVEMPPRGENSPGSSTALVL